MVELPTPLKNDGVSSSVGMIIPFPTEWKNVQNVLNHQAFIDWIFHQPSSELYWATPILRTPLDMGATRLHDMGKRKHPLGPSVSKIFTTAGETHRRKKVEGDWNGTVFRAISEPSLNNAAPPFLNEVSLFCCNSLTFFKDPQKQRYSL